jgi:CarD family transcriptional regulator
MFRVGDTVVYPHHGAGRILEVVEQDCQGSPRRYYSIQILHSDMTVMVPVDATEKAGIRPVISEYEVEEVLGVLRDDATRMPKNWNRRVKHNRDKIKTGDVFEVADVVRNLALRDHDKGLSTGEKQMFGKVRHILASELMYAKDMCEDDALRFLDGILAEICADPHSAEHGSVT